MCGLRFVAWRSRHLHRCRTAPQSRHVGGTNGKTKFRAGHQHAIHSQHVRTVHRLFGGNCSGLPLFASRRSPRVADPNGSVRARTDLVLGRIPQASLFARLRLWDHILPDRCNLYLVCAAHSVRHPHTTVLISVVHHQPPSRRGQRGSREHLATVPPLIWLPPRFKGIADKDGAPRDIHVCDQDEAIIEAMGRVPRQ